MSGRNRERKNRVIAIIASLALVVGLMPIPALAASGTAEAPEDSPSAAAPAVEVAGSEAAALAEEPSEAAAPAEEPSGAAAPVEEKSSEAAPVDEPSEASAPVGESSEAAAPAEEPSEAAAPAEEPATAEYPAFKQSATADGVTVTVEADAGAFPEGAKLSVASAPASATEAAVAPEREANENVAVSYTFDVKVLGADGEELQPANGMSVSVSFKAAEVADPNLDVSVYHVPDAGPAEELDVDVEGSTATAESDGFSYYTVEFTYNNLQYVLPGDSEVALAEILAAVGLVGEPTDAVSSNPDLFGVEMRDGAWTVTAKQAFSSSETLTVIINGTEYEIAVTDEQEGDYSYTVHNPDTANAYVEITGYSGAGGEITIPSELGGVSVQVIGSEAFEDNTDITSVTISEGVVAICPSAFQRCINLKSVTIPEGVVQIDHYAFAYCYSLESVTIPASITRIENSAFELCPIRTIDFGGTPEQWSALSGSFPSGVTVHYSCGDGVYWSLTGEGDNLTLTISGSGAMDNYVWNGAPWYSDRKNIKTVVIGDGVTSIGAYAFSNSKLTSVTIPDGATSIEHGAFAGCDDLASVTFGADSKLTSIGTSAFIGTALTSVDIPAGVKSIGVSAFESNKKLASVTFAKDSGLTSIGNQAFAYCESLTSVTIGSGVTSIGNNAFVDCADSATITIDTYEGKVTEGNNWSGGAKVIWLWCKVTVTANPSEGGIVTVTADSSEDGEVPGSIICPTGAEVTCTATPADGYAFDCWRQGAVDGDMIEDQGKKVGSTYVFEAAEDRILTANFKPVLTITVKDQTYAYDGQPQGEGDPAYEDPGVIAKKVTVEGLQGDDKLASIVLTGQETEHGVYEKAISVTGCQIKNEAGNITTENYAITCVPGTLTITVPLTITAASKTWTYDGDKHADTSVSAELPEGYVLDAYASGSVTNVSDTAKGNNPVAQGYKIYDPDGKDVTRSYVITAEPGTLTIEPEKATITVDSASKVQGTDDPVFAGKVEGLVKDGDLGEVKFVRTGDDEAPGTYKGVLTATYTANPNYDVTVVPGDFTIEAAPAEEYTVTFENWDGTVLQSGKVAAGEVPVYEGAEPTRPETDQYLYVFDGWTPEVVAATADATYTAVFEPALRTYDIIWLNDDGTELYRDVHVSYGQMPDYDGPTPTKPSDGKYTYTFSGWTPEIVTVTGDATYTATYTATPKDKPVYKVVSDAGGTWTEGSGEPMVFKIERTVDPETAFSHFVGIEVDGKAVPEKDASGKANWTAKSGSVIIELQPAYLGTLSAGKHTLTALFDDGDPVTAEFKVAAKATSPKTGDPLTGALVVPIATAVIALIVMVAFAFRRRRV